MIGPIHEFELKSFVPAVVKDMIDSIKKKKS